MNQINITPALLKSILKPIEKNAHKGSNGTLNIIAGSKKFRGAADLCVGGALRSGCGIVRLISEEAVISAVASRHPSCTFLPIDDEINFQNLITPLKDGVFLIGCGIGVNEKSSSRLFYSLDIAKRTVLDADALNIISHHAGYSFKPNTIITPHVTEFSRLSGYTVTEIKSEPSRCALEFSQKNGCVVVLKDSTTMIAVPSGNVYISELASEGLSKGGSGDVLAGLIAGFLAQNYSEEDAAITGVAVHALASRLCASEMGIRSMLPSDLEMYISKLFASVGF